MYKYLTTIAMIIIAGLILLGLGRQISSAIQAGKRLDAEAEEVSKLQNQSQQLKKKLAQTNQPDFVEQVARDKLNMAKPGETVVVVPEQAINHVIASQNPPVEEKLPNWQGWVKLFVH